MPDHQQLLAPKEYRVTSFLLRVDFTFLLYFSPDNHSTGSLARPRPDSLDFLDYAVASSLLMPMTFVKATAENVGLRPMCRK